MQAIRQLDEGKSLFFSHYNPSTVEMIINMGKTAKSKNLCGNTDNRRLF